MVIQRKIAGRKVAERRGKGQETESLKGRRKQNLLWLWSHWMMNSSCSHALQIMQMYPELFKSQNTISELALIVEPAVITAQITKDLRTIDLSVGGISPLQTDVL